MVNKYLLIFIELACHRISMLGSNTIHFSACIYSVCVDRDLSMLEQLELLLFLIVSVYNHLKVSSKFYKFIS